MLSFVKMYSHSNLASSTNFETGLTKVVTCSQARVLDGCLASKFQRSTKYRSGC